MPRYNPGARYPLSDIFNQLTAPPEDAEYRSTVGPVTPRPEHGVPEIPDLTGIVSPDPLPWPDFGKFLEALKTLRIPDEYEGFHVAPEQVETGPQQVETRLLPASKIGQALVPVPKAPTPVPEKQIGQYGEPYFGAKPGYSDPNAANLLRQFMAQKYGQGYADERMVGTPTWEAGGESGLTWANIIEQLKHLPPQSRAIMLDKTFKDWEASAGRRTQIDRDLQAALDKIDELNRKKRSSEALTSAVAGGAVPSGTAFTPEDLKTYEGIRRNRRADKQFELSERREQRLTAGQGFRQQQALTKPPAEAQVNAAAQDILGAEGLSVNPRTGEIKKGNRVLPDSAKRWQEARDKARKQLGLRGGVGNLAPRSLGLQQLQQPDQQPDPRQGFMQSPRYKQAEKIMADAEAGDPAAMRLMDAYNSALSRALSAGHDEATAAIHAVMVITK